MSDAVEYTVRRKVLTLFGAKFHILDKQGNTVGYSKQKAFKLKEDIRVFRDESLSEPWLVISARSILDFGAAYDVTDARTGEKLGALRRKGVASLFRDSWQVLDEHDAEVGRITEDSALMATLRRLHEIAAAVFPQKYHLRMTDGTEAATYQTSINPFVRKMDVTVLPGCPLNPFVPLAAGVLLVAIEGGQ